MPEWTDQDGLPGVDIVVPVAMHQTWRVRESGRLLSTFRYDPPEAWTAPETAAGVEVIDLHLRGDGSLWPHPETARPVTHEWLRTHCTYLPPAPHAPMDDGGRVDTLGRAIEALAIAAGTAGAAAAADGRDALAALVDHYQAKLRGSRAAARQARQTGFDRGRAARRTGR
ncbi:hypothetical protein ACWD0G_19005 [Streptomyces goshikiensis]